MRPFTVPSFVRIIAAVALLALASADRSEAQCTITGPARLCDGTAQLCGPAGNYGYEWNGPNGFFAMDRCITVSTPGSYFLIVFDMDSGAEYGPCLHDLGASVATAACSISGPSSMCEGTSVNLCGPDGTLGYAWSGPAGFAASTKCVTVSVAGTYTLVVSDLASGCSSPPCSHDVSINAAPVASISGPADVCAGSSIDLCGPDGSLGYAWSGPGGFSASAKCVTVSAGGTYSLVVSDLFSGCASSPSTHAVTLHAAPAASISGPAELCAGSSVNLCGPDGGLSYAWSGPGGFTAASKCVTVNTAGSYSLVVGDLITGCTSSPASHSLSLRSLPVAAISGPNALCSGAAITLCGPDGNLSYTWSGPGGFAATSKCVSVSTAGTYSLIVSDLGSGCTSSPGSHAVTVSTAPVASISGPTDACAGSSVQLCGPVGSLSYAWSGPGGFAASSKCVTVSTGGTYSLVVSDLTAGCPSAPANHAVAFHTAPTSSISGPSELCAGSGIELSGPAGSMSYAWSGPGGFTGATASVYVDATGTYQLVVSDATTGCASAPAQHDVAPVQCRTLSNCPRPASFWIRECEADAHAASKLTSADFATIAASVDAHCTFFHWGANARDGFCATLHPAQSTLAARAARQFAAVCANACAGDLGVALVHGRAVALSPATHIDLAGVSTTVGDWLAATDLALASLAGRSPRDPATKAAYKRIVWVAWQINHGIGIGPVCEGSGNGPGPSPHTVSTMSAGADAETELLDDEPLVVEMADDEAVSLQLTQIVPNPFANNARIGFTVVSSATKNVTIGVYDLSGRLVKMLADGPLSPGAYEVRWDGGDVRGGPARNGIYFVLGRLDGQRVQAQVILLR